jgi:FHS family Na+ dependent glucose MFS transporter 1
MSTSTTPRPARYLLSYYASMFSVGLMAACLGPALPTLAASTHSSLQQVSLIFTMRPAGYLAGTLLAGRFLDRRPGHPLLVGALLLTAVALVLTPQMGSLGPLTALVLVLGFGDGTLDVGSNTLLPWVYGDASGPYFNGLHFVFGLGALFAPIIIERALSLGLGMGGGFAVMGLCSLPAVLSLCLIPSPNVHKPSSSPAPGVTHPWSVLLIALVFMTYGGSEAAFGCWIFSYAKASHLADDSSAAYLTSLFWGSLTAGRLAAIPLAMRFSMRRILAVDAIGCLAFIAMPLLWPHSRPFLWISTAGLGLSMSSFFPSLVVFAGRQLSPSGRVSGGLTSVFFVGSSCGAMLIPWLIGQAFETHGPGTAPAVIAVALLAMGLGMALFFKLESLRGSKALQE